MSNKETEKMGCSEGGTLIAILTRSGSNFDHTPSIPGAISKLFAKGVSHISDTDYWILVIVTCRALATLAMKHLDSNAFIPICLFQMTKEASYICLCKL